MSGTRVGLEAIGTYVPAGRLSNRERMAEFGVDEEFLTRKLGIERVARRAPGETTADLCVAAVRALQNKAGLEAERIEALVVVTQNPDARIPHTSAVVHGALGLPERCACFDVSLGCSGYVYGLSILSAFLGANGLRRGVLVTADPYSGILDPADRNTAMLFGDAATATLLSARPRWRLGRFTFGTAGSHAGELAARDGVLRMNGRAIFTFSATTVPEDVRRLLAANGLEAAQVDRFVFHQASRYLVDTVGQRLGLDASRVAFDIHDWGNTVSSSIPLVLEGELERAENRVIVLSGFGVGLSWAGGVLYRCEEEDGDGR